jgi:hypothetical protein
MLALGEVGGPAEGRERREENVLCSFRLIRLQSGDCMVQELGQPFVPQTVFYPPHLFVGSGKRRQDSSRSAILHGPKTVDDEPSVFVEHGDGNDRRATKIRSGSGCHETNLP